MFPFACSKVIFIIFITLFCIVSLAHLIFSFVENEIARKFTKPFCLVFLAVAVIFASPKEFLVYLGVIFGLIGDIALIWKRNKLCFKLGLFAFMVGHFLYLAESLTIIFAYENLDSIWWLFYGLIFAACIGLLFLPLKRFTKKNRGFVFICSLYASSLAINLITAISGIAFGYPKYFVLVSIGYFLFIVSDVTLSYTLFRKEFKRRDFFIMITYLAAQLLICIGFLLTASL